MTGPSRTAREWAELIADQFCVTDAAAIDAIEEGVVRGKAGARDALIRARDMAYGPSRDSCAFCDSVRHEDGLISHDEDCPESYIEKALEL